MSLLFDVVIIAVCVLTIVMGAKKGFVKSLMNLGSNIASFFLASAFYRPLSVYIKDNWLQKALSDGIASTIKAISSSGSADHSVTYDLSKLFQDMPDSFTQILNRYKMDYPDLQNIYGNSSDVVESTVDSLASAISSSVASMLSNIIAFALIFFASIIALSIVTWILDLIFKLPVLRTANSFFGLLFGLVCAALLMWLLSTLSIYLIDSMSSVNPENFNSTVIQNSVILKFFNEHNFFEMFMLKN